jgi:hypothetical protein
MKTIDTFRPTRSLYAAAWQHAGPGMLVVMMCIVMASAAMFREQAAVANAAGVNAGGDLVFDHRLSDSDLRRQLSINHSVRLTLPLTQLRNSSGRVTPNGESLFLLLARRMKSLSLSIMLTANSTADAEFAVTIAGHMMREVPLESTQLRISSDEATLPDDPARDSVLTVTITRHETVDGDLE